MRATIETESTLTDRYQTTVPESVRRALKLGKRDKICFTVRPGGEVVLSRAVAPEDADPALDRFLEFLAQDMTDHPERLRALDTGLATRIQSLVGDLDVDLDAPLPKDGAKDRV